MGILTLRLSMGADESPGIWMNCKPSFERLKMAFPTTLRLTSFSLSPLRIWIVRLATAAVSRIVRVDVCPLISPCFKAATIAED